MKAPYWTEYEIEYLRNHYHEDGARSCGAVLGRSPHATMTKANRLGLDRGIKPEYSQTELAYMRSHYGIDSVRDIAKRLGRSVSSVKNKFSQLGIRRYFIWTPEKVEILKERYHDTLVVDLMEELGASRWTIIRKAHRLGLKKDPGFVEANRSRISELQSRAQAASGKFGIKDYRKYLEDHPNVTPLWEHGRGKKRSPETIEKMRQGMRKTFEAERRRLRWGMEPKLKRKLKI